MSKQEELSAFLDGELSVEAQAQLFEALAGQEALREQWRCYQLIGDGLRQARLEWPLASGLEGRVMAQLASEPDWKSEDMAPVTRPAGDAVSFPPHDVRRAAANQARWSQWSGLAAALSGVAVVAWLALSAPGAGEVRHVDDARAPMLASTAQGTAAAAPQTEAATLALADASMRPAAVPAPVSPRQSETSATPLEDAQAEHLRTYLVAHQAYASAHRFEGGAAYIRTVAAPR